jgi:hypothetical protein
MSSWIRQRAREAGSPYRAISTHKLNARAGRRPQWGLDSDFGIPVTSLRAKPRIGSGAELAEVVIQMLFTIAAPYAMDGLGDGKDWG